jgi:MrfA Zn-binding domain
VQAQGQLRRGQVITTYGPGALIDLPHESAIVAGLETWPSVTQLDEIVEPRLVSKLQTLTGVTAPQLYAPPPDSSDPREPKRGIGAFRFPEWFVVQEKTETQDRERSRRLVQRKALDRGQFEKLPVVATRFVRACPRGHVADLDWRGFVHLGGDNESSENCLRQLWLDERGTSGDLIDLVVRCECGKSRALYEATVPESHALGTCTGQRPWLGMYAAEPCGWESRLLIRTASNAYFPQVMSALSLPDQQSAVESAVQDLWTFLQIVDSQQELDFARKHPGVSTGLAGFSDADVLAAIKKIKSGVATERPVKQVELDSLIGAPEGFGEDVPVHPDFHARRLPEHLWRRSSLTEGIAAVVQVHRLREVLALVGFTRFEALTPDIDGEYDTDVRQADLAQDPKWFPAVENRGEGIFLLLRTDAVKSWLDRPKVVSRLESLASGHDHWLEGRQSKREFPGGPYVLLHTLSHLLIQSLAMRCGYPASSIRERVYSDPWGGRYGLLLYTGSPDAEGTLGGLVEQARHIDDHLAHALGTAALCSNDPICAQHSPQDGLESRWLLGAACHGCTLVAETSCEMRNDYLDRALVIPILGQPDAAFFETRLG